MTNEFPKTTIGLIIIGITVAVISFIIEETIKSRNFDAESSRAPASRQQNITTRPNSPNIINSNGVTFNGK